jgi:phenylalanyl-tRNA synthetase beta chain
MASLQVYGDAGPTWHPGRSARLGLGPKTIVASFGEIHPNLQKKLGAPAGAMAAEIYLDALPASRASGHSRSAYSPPPLQAISRDFAFIVPVELAAEKLLRAIRAVDKSTITEVRLFDRFETTDGLSLAFEVTLQPIEASFTDEQIGEISRRIVGAAEKLGARLRS